MIGTAKNTASQPRPGSSRRYGVSRRPRLPSLSGGSWPPPETTLLVRSPTPIPWATVTSAHRHRRCALVVLHARFDVLGAVQGERVRRVEGQAHGAARG